ncbi:methyltransferase [Actinacidiphila epipremni]
MIADTTGGDRRLAAFATPAPLPAGAAPAGEDAGWAAARGAYRRLARAADPAALRRSSDLLRAAVHASLAHLLTECGVFAAGDVREEDEVLAALGAAPEHRPLARRWLAALADAGRLRRLPGARWEGLRTADAADAERAWDAAVEGTVADLWPREVVELFRSAAGQLPALVRGEQQAAQLLFPQGDSRTARAAFGGSLAVRALNGAVGAFVRAEARSRAGTGRPLRVLEVGAGVGATTDEVIAALDGTGTGPAADAGTAPYVEYVYTDVSLFFLNAAQERHAHLPWITHTVFDIDADYRAQGFEPNTFDVILGANVLHNARDLGRCLARMRGLLAPGGALVLTEATRERPELMVSMDFLIGAQLGGEGFADDRAGSGGALLDAGQWRERLAAAGGVAPPALPESAADPLAGSGMALVAARFKPRLAAPDPGELLDHLAEQVPAYMVPAHLQVVDELPLTANGKVDTAMLRSWLPRSAPARSSGWVPPRGPLEERIAEVWAALLGSERVGRDDDFFHSGGDSLLAARFAARLRETLPAAAARPFDAVLRQLTAGPTVAALAAWLALGAEDAQEAQDGQGAR